MADHTPTGPLEVGANMDYAEHERTYHRFLGLAKYGSLVCAALLIAMAFSFFTTAGFFSATRAVHHHLRGRRLHSSLSEIAAASSPRPRARPAEQRSAERASLVGQTVFVPKEIDARAKAARGGVAGHGEADGRARLRRWSSSAAPAAVAHCRRGIRQPRAPQSAAPRMPAGPMSCSRCGGRARPSSTATRRAPRSSPSWTPMATMRRSPRMAKAGVTGVRHGVHAAHHPRPGRWTCCPARPTSPATRR